jgi:hypothetical protein
MILNLFVGLDGQGKLQDQQESRDLFQIFSDAHVMIGCFAARMMLLCKL